MPPILRLSKQLNFLTVLNSSIRKMLKKPKEVKKQRKCLKINMSITKIKSFNLSEKKNMMKKLMS